MAAHDGTGRSETWYPRTRRRDLAVGVAGCLLLAALALWLLLAPDGQSRPLFALLFAANAVWLGYLAWEAWTHRVVADADGLRVVRGRRSVTFPWAEITEVRPMNLGGRRPRLVVLRPGAPIAGLPLDESHLEAVRRWHADMTAAP